MKTEIEGFPAVLPTNPVTIAGSSLNAAFTGNQFYVNGYEHTFRMPSANGAGGFLTKITALDVPTLGAGGDGPLL